ncbi:MAG: hypothetical protein ACT4NY_31145 [Pseudonocardiales bacterium]
MIDKVRIGVIQNDALRHRTDVLVLKYAQTLYGVDKHAVMTSGIIGTDFPKPWEYRIFPGPRGIAARNLIFIGVPPLWEFGYGEIREFGRLAVELSLAEFSSAREITLTLHGPGFRFWLRPR